MDSSPDTDNPSAPPPLRAIASFEEAEQARRERHWAMDPTERSLLQEEIRRAHWPEVYRNPRTETGPLKAIPCPWMKPENC